MIIAQGLLGMCVYLYHVNELLHYMFSYHSNSGPKHAVHLTSMDIDAQLIIFWSDDKKYSTVLVSKCISSISYEEIKTAIPCIAGFSLSFFAIDKEQCENVSLPVFILPHNQPCVAKVM